MLRVEDPNESYDLGHLPYLEDTHVDHKPFLRGHLVQKARIMYPGISWSLLAAQASLKPSCLTLMTSYLQENITPKRFMVNAPYWD